MKRSLVAALATIVLSACLSGLLPAKQAVRAETTYSIVRFVVCTGIDKREPLASADSFPAATEKLYCFLEAKDIAEDTQVTFVWFHANKEVHRYALPLKKGPFWRTWAECRLMGRAGEWKAEIQDTGGNSVKAVTFTVK